MVYFRISYMPWHISKQEDWDAREMIEMSQAIKCPSIDLQIAGLKRLQGEYKNKEVLQQFAGFRNKKEDLPIDELMARFAEIIIIRTKEDQ